MKKHLILLSIVLLAIQIGLSQTNPTAQTLPYTQNFGTSSFSTLPAGIAAWTVNNSPIGTQNNAESSTNNGNATLTAATTVQTAGGIFGYSNSSNARLYIQTSSNTANGTNQLATAINTTGKIGIHVSYDIEMISATARTIGVELQYRIGVTGTWTSVPGSVYSHNNVDRVSGAVDNFINIALPSVVDNNAVVQLRWVTWRGSESGNSSGIAIDNISIDGSNQQTWYYRSIQSGDWNLNSTWQASSDSINWISATMPPSYNSNFITIQSGHIVSINASVTIDQIVINGNLIYGNISGSVISINDGLGADFNINGTFEDLGPSSVIWLGNSTWSMGANGTLLKTRGTSSNNWRDNYQGGISNIPSTSNWIVRKTGTDSPVLSSVGNMHYPNLIIENTSGSVWYAEGSSGFIGSSSNPKIKGNLNIGGTGTSPVFFVDSNLNVNLTTVYGNLDVQQGSKLTIKGSGIDLKGNLVVNGEINYGTSNKNLALLSGTNNQNISGNGIIKFKNLKTNKSTSSSTFEVSVEVLDSLILSNGIVKIISPAVLKLNGTSSLGSDNSHVSGSIQKVGNTAFVFPLGNNTNALGSYHPMLISEPSLVTDAYTASYYSGMQTNGITIDTLEIDSLSTCEFWTLDRTAGTSQVKVGLTWTASSCDLPSDLKEMRLAYWDGTKWVNKGDVVLVNTVTSNNNLNAFGTFTLAQEACPIRKRRYSLQVTGSTAVCSGAPIVDLVASVSPSYNGTYSWTVPTSLSGNTYSVTPINTGSSPVSNTYTAQFQFWIGCVSAKSHTLTVNPNPIVNAGNDVTVCYGVNLQLNGSVSLNANVVWQPANVLNDSTIVNPIATPIAITTFTMTATSNEGCIGIDSVLITVTNIIKINVSSGFSVCPDEVFQLSASGAQNYAWQPLEITSNFTEPIITSAIQSNTMFYVFGSSGDCEASDSVEVIVKNLPSFTLDNDTFNICSGSTISISATGTGNFEWYVNDTTLISNSSSVSVSPTEYTMYTVFLNEDSACVNSKSAIVNVDNLIISVPTSITLLEGQSQTIQVSSNADTFDWSPGIGLSDSTLVSPNCSAVASTTYTLAATKGQCTSVKEVEVSVTSNTRVYFTYSYPGLTVNFATPNLVSSTYSWSFGDGGVSNDSSPQHIFASPGEYRVVLRVENVFGVTEYSDLVIVR